MSKKVLVISNSIRCSVLFHADLFRDLIRCGYEVVNYVSLDKGVDNFANISFLNEIGVRNVVIKLNNTKLNPFCDICLFLKLVRLIKKERPSYVLNYMVKPIIYGSLAARCAKVQNIYSVISGLGYAFIGKSYRVMVLRFIVKKMYKVALKFNVKVFFQNPDDLSLFAENSLLPKDRAIMVNGSGVNIDEFLPSPFPVDCAFFMAARLIRDKGINEYICAARQIKQHYPNVKFLLAGDIDSNPTAITMEWLKSLISEGVIEYLGWVDVRKVFERVSVFVLPSYREGTPKSVLEALAAGRPVITTDAPGCRETVKYGVNGYLVAVKSVDQLVEMMKKFILNPELIAKMGKESRRIAEEKYDVRKVNQVMLEAMNISLPYGF